MSHTTPIMTSPRHKSSQRQPSGAVSARQPPRRNHKPLTSSRTLSDFHSHRHPSHDDCNTPSHQPRLQHSPPQQGLLFSPIHLSLSSLPSTTHLGSPLTLTLTLHTSIHHPHPSTPTPPLLAIITLLADDGIGGGNLLVDDAVRALSPSPDPTHAAGGRRGREMRARCRFTGLVVRMAGTYRFRVTVMGVGVEGAVALAEVLSEVVEVRRPVARIGMGRVVGWGAEARL